MEKHISYILMAFMTIFLISCDKDDDIDNMPVVQSVTFVSDYSDGSFSLTDSGTVNLKCLVSPASALKGLTKDNFTIMVNTVNTPGGKLYTLPASSALIDESLGLVRVESDLTAVLDENRTKDLAIALHINTGTTTYTSSFANLANMIIVPNGIEPKPSVKQIDMTVVVPIHPSSLEYFDYVIHYTDNLGEEHNDTIRENTNGIVVEEWNYIEHEVTNNLSPQDNSLRTDHNDTIRENKGGITVEEFNYLESKAVHRATRASLTGGDCYVRFFSFDQPVQCHVTITMLPKDETPPMATFYFCNPKPYIFPSVHFSTTPSRNEPPYSLLEEIEQIFINNMSISTFLTEYGTTFTSSFGVIDDLDGFKYYFY